jgi:hypothetical protein
MIIKNIFEQFIASSSLSSAERLKAVQRLNMDLRNADNFLIICGVILTSLVMLFIIISLVGSMKRKKNSNKLFIEYADKRGLNIRERHILMDIAIKSRIRFAESIFTMGDVFDRGATQLMRVTLAKYGAKRSRYLSAELSILREKLGFKKRSAVSELAMKPGGTGSRQIPEGRKLYLTNPEITDYFETETIIIENKEHEFNVQLTQQVECEPGDSFCARYYFGALIWEFDTCVLEVKDNILVLQHSDNIRYVNRRRFLRVNVNEAAYIAAFPFTKNVSDNEKSLLDEERNSYERTWGPPKFVPAEVTELAGPGLKITAPLEVNAGDRVIVILKTKSSHSKDSNVSDFHQNENTGNFRIIEDIGVVKHAEKMENDFSIAVELTGLNDKNISEMVRITNEVSINNKRIIDIQPVSKEKSNKWEYISETTVN